MAEEEKTVEEIPAGERQLNIPQALNMWQNMSGVALTPIQKQALERLVNLIAESHYKRGKEDLANLLGEDAPREH